MRRLWRACAGALVLCVATRASAQPPTSEDTRTQYPAFLANSYFAFNVGSIQDTFSEQQLEPGFHAPRIDTPHLAVRVDLFGHYFTKYLAAQATYMRPARYVSYYDVDGGRLGQVKQAYGGVTLRGDLPLNARVTAYGEGGWGITSRGGFDVNGKTAMRDVQFGGGLMGAGFAYHATPTMDFMIGVTYVPGSDALDQPSAWLLTGGYRYRMRPLPDAEVEGNRRAGFVFPANVVRAGYSTNRWNYGVNHFFSRTIPLFWSGDLRASQGVTLDYQRNTFHTKKWFAFDVGASASYWKSHGKHEVFRTLSLYPLLRFFVARTGPADLYFSYSLAGPSYMSQTVIDGSDTGEHFTFQDFLSVGMFLGKARHMNAEVGIKHYSNGNIFTRNPGIDIPLTITLGMAF